MSRETPNNEPLGLADPRSAQLREIVRRAVAGEAPAKGGIFAALRRSPLVGADLEIDRPVLPGRKVEL